MLLENGVDTIKFRAASSLTFKPTFLFIGRFALTKGIDDLIETFAALSQHVPEARLHIVGTDWGDLLTQMQEQIARLGCNDRITIHVNLSDGEIKELMAECSFFASASKYEGFALTARECSAGGLIPVVNNIGAFRELIDATKVGKIVDFSDAEVAGRQIAEFLTKTAPSYTEFREKVIDASLPYDWSEVALRTTKEYDKLL